MEVNVWNNLPSDLICEILSYGDPTYNQKYINVLKQLIYYKKEFDYKRNNKGLPSGRWFNVSENYYYRYALRETFLKKHVNKFYGDLKDNNEYNTMIRYNFINVNYTHNNTIIDTIVNTNLIDLNMNNYTTY